MKGGTVTTRAILIANPIMPAVGAGELFRSSPPQTASLSDGRRLADSNRCKVPLASAQPCGEPSVGARSTDFVTETRPRPYSTGDVTVPSPGLSLRPGGSHQAGNHLLPSRRTHPLHHRTRTSPELARTALVADPGALHPLTRGGVERRDRQRLRGRDAVPPLDVGQCRRTHARLPLGVGGDAAGAALPGVAGVAPRRRLLAGMGNRSSVRAAVSL